MKIGIIGGGPAGMMAAIQASKSAQVTLLEQNEKLGKKIYITGKGRCNFTNSKDISEFFEEVVRNPHFLYSAFYTFSNEALVNFLKLPYKVERGGRIFPKSDKSSDVIRALERACADQGVHLLKSIRVKDIDKTLEGFLVKTSKEDQLFDKLIIATGGKSYPLTGAQGDGYKFAKKFGHRIIPLKPALVPLLLEDSWVKDLEGLALKNVLLKASGDGQVEEFGEALFTKKGISGPIALKLSSLINRWDKVDLSLDLKPALDYKTLDSSLLRDFDANKNKEIASLLRTRLPHALVDIFLRIVDLDPHKKIHEIKRENRDQIIKTFKNFPLHYQGLGPLDSGIVTSGGVDTLEIDPSTMESKYQEGLYFCGEVLDLDAFTGGYNLQIAFSTGFLAGDKSRQSP